MMLKMLQLTRFKNNQTCIDAGAVDIRKSPTNELKIIFVSPNSKPVIMYL